MTTVALTTVNKGTRLAEIVRANATVLPGLQASFNLVERAARGQNNPFIESGDPFEREALARELHGRSPEAAGRFVHWRCAGELELTLYATLLGRMDDAVHAAGCLARASRGVLYVDGIEHLPIELQYRLSAFIDSGEFTPIGASAPVKSGARLVLK